RVPGRFRRRRRLLRHLRLPHRLGHPPRDRGRLLPLLHFLGPPPPPPLPRARHRRRRYPRRGVSLVGPHASQAARGVCRRSVRARGELPVLGPDRLLRHLVGVLPPAAHLVAGGGGAVLPPPAPRPG